MKQAFIAVSICLLVLFGCWGFYGVMSVQNLSETIAIVDVTRLDVVESGGPTNLKVTQIPRVILKGKLEPGEIWVGAGAKEDVTSSPRAIVFLIPNQGKLRTIGWIPIINGSGKWHGKMCPESQIQKEIERDVQHK